MIRFDLKKLTALAGAAVLAAGFCSCGTGDVLFEKERDGLCYTVYGSEAGVRLVTVTNADGEKLSQIKVTAGHGGSEPYEPGDGLDYGFVLCDIDADGDDDAAIQTRRKEGWDRYDFWLNDGSGRFTKQKQLSGLTAPVFGDGSGLIGFHSHSIEREPQVNPNSPEIYTETDLTVYWRIDENGVARKDSGRALIYYSESDIYCIATYIPEKKNSDVLVPDTEKWVDPDRLSEYGYEPFTH